MNEPALSLSGQLAKVLDINGQDTTSIRVRNSHLKAMSRSAAHCRYAMLNETEPTLSKRIGSGAHSLLLGGPPLVCWNGKQRRGKDFDSFKAQQPADALIYLRKDYDRAHRIADAVRGNEQARNVLFTPGVDLLYESTIEWDWLGRSRRCTPDVRSDSHLAELKTTRNASPDKFKWDVLRFGYHAQLADYSNAIFATRGLAPRDVLIVAVESNPPFVVSVYRLTANDLDLGMRMCRAWMERLLVCEQTNTWPGYCESIQDLDLPVSDDVELVFSDDDGDATDGDEP